MKKPFYKSLRQSVPLIVLFSTLTLAAFAGEKTYVGTVGDVMCGMKHVTDSSASCTHMCVQHGSKYALLIKEKVYTLDTKDRVILDQLNDLAGKTVSVRGTAEGNTIQVNAVKVK